MNRLLETGFKNTEIKRSSATFLFTKFQCGIFVTRAIKSWGFLNHITSIYLAILKICFNKKQHKYLTKELDKLRAYDY